MDETRVKERSEGERGKGKWYDSICDGVAAFFQLL